MTSSRFYSNDELASKIQKLNTCYDVHSLWQQRKAQKEHVDLFGQKINEGDSYFRLSIDGRHNNDLKLSRDSMDKFLYAIFAPAPNWEEDADTFLEREVEKARTILDNLRSKTTNK